MDTLAHSEYFRRFLLATGRSDFSSGAERVSIAMAEKCGATLIGMTMVFSNPELDAIAPERAEVADEDACNYLDRLAADCAQRNVAFEPLVRHGSEPADEIVAAADEVDADIIVMGRRGQRGLARLMLGHATARVVGYAHCSVLVVPRAGQMWQRRILLATDGSRFSDAAAEIAQMMARECNLPVTVISTIREVFSPERGREAVEAAERTTAAFRQAGIETETTVLQGDPEERIVEIAAARDVDLIIMGTHGRTGFQRALLGSVTERVIGATRWPVLAVKLQSRAEARD
jgi:nucleotide-binding universal stress UspA family protein